MSTPECCLLDEREDLVDCLPRTLLQQPGNVDSSARSHTLYFILLFLSPSPLWPPPIPLPLYDLMAPPPPLYGPSPSPSSLWPLLLSLSGSRYCPRRAPAAGLSIHLAQPHRSTAGFRGYCGCIVHVLFIQSRLELELACAPKLSKYWAAIQKKEKQLDAAGKEK